MAPHLLPLDHPMKSVLDSIFSQSRVIENQQTLTDAGFSLIAVMQVSFIIVAKHPLMPGYVFKLYLDSEKRYKKKVPHWLALTRRCTGAKKIKKRIQKQKIQYFTVPDKWLYILPLYPSSKEEKTEPVIIIETDMDLAENSEFAWKNYVKPKHLDELYLVYQYGYGSTFLPGNVPYTKQGKFAFVDTEQPRRRPKMSKAKHYLSKNMQRYWEELIRD